MKRQNIRKLAAQAMLLAPMAGTGWLAGCADVAPVGEYRVAEARPLRPGVYRGASVRRTRTVERLEPVAERRVAVDLPSFVVTRPGDRYYNPMTMSWERPWPYGPYGTANWR